VPAGFGGVAATVKSVKLFAGAGLAAEAAPANESTAITATSAASSLVIGLAFRSRGNGN